MLNLLQGGNGQLTLGPQNMMAGPQNMMAPTISGISQTCLLQGLSMNGGLLSVAPTSQGQPQPQVQLPLLPPAQPQPHVQLPLLQPSQPQLQVQLPLLQPAPPKPVQLPPICMKRAAIDAASTSASKKLKVDWCDKLKIPNSQALTQAVIMNYNCAFEKTRNTRPKRKMSEAFVQEIVDLDLVDNEDPFMIMNGLLLDLTVDVKTEFPMSESARESPVSDHAEDFSPNFDNFEDRFLEEKEKLLVKRGSPHLRFEIISEDGFLHPVRQR
ncbi:unnamed protein product [Ranitomeya imitator]|uniref:Uncharacterized protein n=1 Tax=Ranitomeya imitator TaxID=111125 RepID=A0ABN9L3E4_9NEOB|nr:unnamed protein product [Ranitomeya imitator]